MRVIGTAGHVDHGKSTLIQALTGTHPDRLKEEQAREMTIELGFGWMTLPNGEEVGIVDVPGHRDFIENMLSGISGIDAALLIIAADEGIMPQTKEHLAILDLLQIPAGLIVLTKTDLAPDSNWLDLLETDIRATVKGTVLHDAPIIGVSAKNRSGLDVLIPNIESLLESKPVRPDLKRPRLPIDRVFTMSGFGTVVTGTLSDGHLTIGDEVEILPNGIKGRIRGLQTHKKKEETAIPGSRTAVNISGVEVESINRGDVVTLPGQYQPTRRLDARLRILKDASASIKHNDEVKVFVGASETMAVLRLLGREELSSGEEGWIQLELRNPVITVRGDRYILRRPSPGETLGGGDVIDHQPKGRHKRFDEDVLKSLDSLSKGSPRDVLLEAAHALQFAPLKDVIAKSRLDVESAETAFSELTTSGQLINFNDDEKNPLVVDSMNWNIIKTKIDRSVTEYHSHYPLRRGIPREELKSRLKVTARAFNAIIKKLAENNDVSDARGIISRPGFEIKFNAGQQAKVMELNRKFESHPYATPSVKECQSEVGEDVFNALIDMGEFITVSKDIIFRVKDYDKMVRKIKAALQQNGQITLAEVRDMLGTTRKYIQALLEHLDTVGVTMRDGDVRKLK